MSKIGLFFGSFNPVHNAHLQIARQVIKEKVVDKVWFVLARQNPFKDKYDISDIDRISMILSVAEHPLIGYSLIELTGELTSTKTYDVYHYFKNICNPEDKFIIVCGSDTYNEIPKWYRGDELLKEEFCIFDRDPNDISSSIIREKIKSGQDFKEFVPDAIYNYIKKHNLYVDTTET